MALICGAPSSQDWSAVTVKVSLCLGLLFTFPVMLVPVYEIVEGKLLKLEWFLASVRPSLRPQAFNAIRMLIVGLTVVTAAVVPGFGLFISLVGTLGCQQPPSPYEYDGNFAAHQWCTDDLVELLRICTVANVCGDKVVLCQSSTLASSRCEYDCSRMFALELANNQT